MSEENKKTEAAVNSETPETVETENIKATDFVEPNGKGRKILKWVLGGVAMVLTFVGGVLTGKSLDGKGESEEAKEEETQAA